MTKKTTSRVKGPTTGPGAKNRPSKATENFLSTKDKTIVRSAPTYPPSELFQRIKGNEIEDKFTNTQGLNKTLRPHHTIHIEEKMSFDQASGITRPNDFWSKNRPYIFARRKGNNDEITTRLDIDKIWGTLREDTDAHSRFDDSFSIYLSKNEANSLPVIAPSISSLIDFGIPRNFVQNIWRADDDDVGTGNFWQHTGRAFLYALFSTGHDTIPKDTDFAKYLMEAFTDNQRRMALTRTLFLCIANDARPSFVETLLDLGASPDSTIGIFDNRTALAIAVEDRDIPVIKILLAHGADPNFTHRSAGTSGRDAANENRFKDILKLFNSPQK